MYFLFCYPCHQQYIPFEFFQAELVLVCFRKDRGGKKKGSCEFEVVDREKKKEDAMAMLSSSEFGKQKSEFSDEFLKS